VGPIDGTRWRNEFVNDHENHGVGVHYGIAPVVSWPHRELPNTARLGGLLGASSGCWLYFHQARMETHYDIEIART